jgi:hypothetical protein
MRNHRRFPHAAMAPTILATVLLLACQTTEQKAPVAAATAAAAPAAEAVYVIFEGPWAIVPDPKDANNVLAIAPKTKSHRNLAVTPANIDLDAGVYEVAVPAHGTPGPLDLDKGFFRTTVDPKSVQHALDGKSIRYAIRIPKPEFYRAETRSPSRVGKTYPPDASTQQNYVTAVSLVYNVSSRNGFSITGTKDSGGAIDPVLLQLDTPTVRFAIEPAGENLGADKCYTHSRQAFHDLVKLVGLTLYTDFPNSPDSCHKKDPQLAFTGNTQEEQTAGLFSEDITPSYTADISGALTTRYSDSAVGKLAPRWAAVMYFFHAEGGACTAAIIFGI